MMRIHTVAAGGGSVCSFDGARYRVGPESAGADPGPASYRRGGPLCVTDCNVLLGKLQPEFFPRVFGPNQDEPLDHDVVAVKFAALADEIGERTGRRPAPVEVAEGFLRIAVDNMANAIKSISVRRGYDVTGYTLNCFGGAGGQHACLVADALGITRVMIHPLAGVLSAYGMGLADVRALRDRAVETRLDTQGAAALDEALDTLAGEAHAELADQGIAPERIVVHRRAHVRYEGTDTPDLVEAGTSAQMKARFEDAHRRRYGFVMPEKALVIEAASVEAVGAMEEASNPFTVPAGDGRHAALEPVAKAAVHLAGMEHDTPVLRREAFATGEAVDGPAIILESTATTVVEPGWRARLAASGDLVLERVVALARQCAVGTDCDPVMLEVFNNRFMSIAEQMGLTLENTAYSVNIKERLDFSCAIFDPEGMLVANAPHIPIHLGSMSEKHPHRHPRERGKDEARGRVLRERSLQRRHPPAGRDGHHPGVRRRRSGRRSERVAGRWRSLRHGKRLRCIGSRTRRTAGWRRPRRGARPAHSLLRREPGAITPTSAARCPARCRLTRPPSRRKASSSTTSCSSTAAAFSKPSFVRIWARAGGRPAIRTRTWRI